MDTTLPPTPKKEGPSGAWKPVFLAHFSQTGNATESAEKAGVNRKTPYDAAKSDAEFAEAWESAREEAADRLEAEARRRAVEGTERPVFFQGVECGRIREYSDTLLIVLLKAARPHKYRESAHVTMAGDQANPLQHQHEHRVSVIQRIADLQAAFLRGARRALPGPDPGDGAGKPLDS